MIRKIKKLISSFFIEPTIVSPFTKTLEGTIIVITGGNKGVGKAVVEGLKREGATLVVLARNITNAEIDTVTYIKSDITSESEVKQAIEMIRSKFEKIDVLINNAGIFMDKVIEDTSVNEFDNIIQTNVKGMFLMCKYILPIMKKNKSGLIINIGSKISHNTNITPKKVLYATTKYAIEGFSLALKNELRTSGIRVACIMPGTMNTFVSTKSKQYMTPYTISFIISMIIKCEDIDFESILLKSKNQLL